MRKEKNILVSTTSSLSGIEIRRYLKPISAHVVAGTGFSSDFIASFTDVFGGRSKTYQNQLVSLYNEAIEQLKQTAMKIGANGIIGLHVDMDEISGKGKSMFMITAIGTAIIIDEKKADSIAANSSLIIDLDAIEKLRKRKEIIDEANSNDLVLDDENWEFIKSNQLYEVSDYVFDSYKKAYQRNAYDEQLPGFFEAIKEYLDEFDDSIKTRILYDRILIENNEEIRIKLCELIESSNLLDFKYINKILESDDFSKKKIATRLLTHDKLSYEREDLREIENMISKIQSCFPETGAYSQKKGLFSSKEKEVWTCSCGKTNNQIGETCTSCSKDIYGFTVKETSPPDVVEILEERKALLNELLNNNY